MIPDPLDTSRNNFFLQVEQLGPSQLEYYEDSMRMKRDLALVCKQWNTLSRMYLYEFIWISRASQATMLARTLRMEDRKGYPSSGRYIRRLHIQTSTFHRCAPVDIKAILDFASQLLIFTDCHSIKQSCFEPMDPCCSSQMMFSNIARHNKQLKYLKWTNYDDLFFQMRMPTPFSTPQFLEYLDLSSCSGDLLASFAPDRKALAIDLPALRALKVEVDDFAFAIFASWYMPLLQFLSVVSCEFNYHGRGFSLFFQAHGSRLVQLELGHSSSLVESHVHTLDRQPFPLAAWCPNLRELICSADAEWHWQTPDWIPPHVLLPTHPTIDFIGIRGIDARLKEMDDTFTLLEQLSSLQRAAFPSLRCIRDLSPESHAMRTCRPSQRITNFWTRLVKRCQEQGVWLEDLNGVNITSRALKRASLDVAW